MRPSQILRSSEIPIGKYGHFLNKDTWGNLGCIIRQKGIITYTISPNRQKIFAGAFHDAVFNTWRRFTSQVLYWAPPLLAAYYAMDWANKRNEYLNSKAGRAEFKEG
ncbi:UcrQ-domain-containing protein [Daldinia caldariorum]|uniref:UcrQ-domain-containing protein n=1 Tax=Daldinia caldariorum TaxID=326644 RepID=UPI0020073F4D|nr:UcrQ-domain-containing protein [Daldinia caldariorum]KAI1473108.1 UcrQ-domain-containing protein [Daldinia caldariorum]